MKKRIFFTAVLSATIFFAGCYNEVFYDIMQDVAPEDATVSGNISAITRYTVSGTEYLVVNADSGLRYKKALDSGHGNWKTLDGDKLPFDFHSYDYFDAKHNGEQLIKILANETTLYLVTVSYKNDDSEGISAPTVVKLYGAEISDWDAVEKASWTEIIGEAESSEYFKFEKSDTYYYTTLFGIFQTNAPQKEHRRAYIRAGNSNATYYELSGTASPQLKEDVKTQEVQNEKSSTNRAQSAVWFGGDVLFFNATASTTNETYNKDATHFYYASGKTVYHSKAVDSVKYSAETDESFPIEEATLDADAAVSALMTCADALIIGRGDFSTSSSTTSSGGLKKTSLDKDGRPGTELIDFETNAKTKFNSYHIISLLNATPGETETKSDMYTSITFRGTGSTSGGSAKNIGLWSYYPDRGNWNRE